MSRKQKKIGTFAIKNREVGEDIYLTVFTSLSAIIQNKVKYFTLYGTKGQGRINGTIKTLISTNNNKMGT